MSLFAAFSRVSLLLAAMAAHAAEFGRCSEKRSTTLGTTVWARDGRGNWSASTAARQVGTAALRCRVDLPEPSSEVTLVLQQALISFIPSATKEAASGLRIELPGRAIDLTRVAGEDWIETGPKEWHVRLPAPARRFYVVFTLHDLTPRDPVRIDLFGVKVSGRTGSFHEPKPASAVTLERDGRAELQVFTGDRIAHRLVPVRLHVEPH